MPDHRFAPPADGGTPLDGLTPLRHALDSATRTLADAGVPSPRADAEQLAAHLLRCRRGDLTLFDEISEHRYGALVRRRAAREPLQHVTGVAPFRHLSLAVGPGVFVPRPETEVMTGWAVEALRALLAGGVASPLAVDLGTGSGAIALSLLVEVPEVSVHATEADASAHEWAERNLSGSGVTLHRADFSTPLPALDGRVDLVVSNPPYVPETLRGSLDPEVERYDPPAALWGGPDGLDGVRRVAEAAPRLLRPGGLLAVEHHDTHAEAAVAVLVDEGWCDVVGHVDLAGRPRFVTASRPDEATGSAGVMT